MRNQTPSGSLSGEPKLNIVVAGCLGAATVFAFGYGMSRLASHSATAATGRPVLAKPLIDGLELSRLAFVTERHLLGVTAGADAAPVKPQMTTAAHTQLSLVAEQQSGAPPAWEPQASKTQPTSEAAHLLATSPVTGGVEANSSPVQDASPDTVIASDRTPPIALVIERAADGSARARVPISVDMAKSAKNRVMFGRVPSGVTFTTGEPSGTGMWQMRVGEFAKAEFVIDRNAPRSFELTLMLLDPKGIIINGTELAVRVEPAPAAVPVDPKARTAANQDNPRPSLSGPTKRVEPAQVTRKLSQPAQPGPAQPGPAQPAATPTAAARQPAVLDPILKVVSWRSDVPRL